MHYNLFTLPIQQEPVQGENTWLTKGFQMIDDLLDWCEANQIYLILDLHAAPGGQGYDAAISDYDSSLPSLWESDLNKSKTVALWGQNVIRTSRGLAVTLNQRAQLELATYELRTYVQIISHRSVDTNHIIFIRVIGLLMILLDLLRRIIIWFIVFTNIGHIMTLVQFHGS